MESGCLKHKEKWEPKISEPQSERANLYFQLDIATTCPGPLSTRDDPKVQQPTMVGMFRR